ncbi:MAG TPA: hypothetical protein VGA67_03965 [Candidatus Dojkabacteria bacterium]|jgi:hypothetical protein
MSDNQTKPSFFQNAIHIGSMLGSFSISVLLVGAFFSGAYVSYRDDRNVDSSAETSTVIVEEIPNEYKKFPLLFVVEGDAIVEAGRIKFSLNHIEWFADRPSREAGETFPFELVSNWSEWGFETDPPNAAFNNENIHIVIELSDPQVEVDGISFAYDDVFESLEDGTYSNAELFIDGTTQFGCEYSFGQWDIIFDIEFRVDTTTCDQNLVVVEELLNSMPLVPGNIDKTLTISNAIDELNGEWNCKGSFVGAGDGQWIQINGNGLQCNPTDSAKSEMYGFSIQGTATL